MSGLCMGYVYIQGWKHPRLENYKNIIIIIEIIE